MEDQAASKALASTSSTSQPPVKDLALYPSDDEDDEEEVLSHKMVMERYQDGLAEIILVIFSFCHLLNTCSEQK